MSNDDAIAIPEGILGSWQYNKNLGVTNIFCNAFIDYAPGEVYDMLNVDNPYTKADTPHTLLLYFLRVISTGGLGVDANDSYWLGPFCAKVIQGEDDDVKLSIISQFQVDSGEAPLTKNGWKIIPDYPINTDENKGFNSEGELTIYKNLKLPYRDIYNNRFIDVVYNKGILTFVIKILCSNGNCNSIIPTKFIQTDDGKEHVQIKGEAKNGCSKDKNFIISDCLPSNKYQNDSSCTCASSKPPSTTLYKVSIGILLVILVILLMVKIFKKKR